MKRIVDLLVHNYIHHEIHALAMKSATQALEVIGRTEIGVEGIDVLWPISDTYQLESLRDKSTSNSPMVSLTLSRRTLNIFYDWGYPDSIEAHTLDIIQIINDSLPVSATVFLLTRITTW